MGVGSCLIEENGICYFTIGTVAKIVGKSVQTIGLWEKWSKELEKAGEKRLIPHCHRIGKGNIRCWNMEEIQRIVDFSKNIKYGDIAKFSRTRWGTAAEKMTNDRSTEARKEKKIYRRQVNTSGKRETNKRKVEEILKAKGHLLKIVKRRAKQIYEDINYKEN